jgi:hypothetical protein
MILTPPYDGYAVWHQHAFVPFGAAFPLLGDGCDLERYDAIEDRLGRFLVWDAKRNEVLCVCGSRDDALICAIAFATRDD